jgi:hypothetical protein
LRDVDDAHAEAVRQLCDLQSSRSAAQIGNMPQTSDHVFLKVMDDQHGVAGLTMDRATRQAQVEMAA